MIYFSYFVKHEIKLFGFFFFHIHTSSNFSRSSRSFRVQLKGKILNWKTQNNVQIPIGLSILHYCDFADVIILIVIKA